jgi:hypothetical protein
MPRKGRTNEEIVHALHQVEGGEKVTEVWRRLGSASKRSTAGESRPRDPRQRVRRDTARMGALRGTSGSCRIPQIAGRFGLSDVWTFAESAIGPQWVHSSRRSIQHADCTAASTVPSAVPPPAL